MVGKGGFGTVLKGTYKTEEVAVKVFYNTPWAEIQRTKPCQLEEILKEFELTSTLKHRNIIQVFGCILYGGDGYFGIVMELANGGTLKLMIPKQEFRADVGMQYEVLLGVAKGLRYIHRKKVMHRDIKPDNILIFKLRRGLIVPKIADLGEGRVSRKVYY